MAERVNLKKLLKFANKVREAGGGNPLDALMPAVPQDSKQCLIAKNLNFNCRVYSMTNPEFYGEDGPKIPKRLGYDLNYPYLWAMFVTKREVRDNLAEKLRLPKVEAKLSNRKAYGIVLPANIGAVAEDFDKVLRNVTHEGTSYHLDSSLAEFWPYIKASEKEAYKNATIVTEEGKIVI